jgi:hypothetical protein
MASTVIESVRNVVSVDDVQKFRIVVVCTAKGDLPDPGVFVHEILDSDDPAKDEFDRVAEIIDFETLLHDRVAAVRAGDTYWRSYLLTKFYTDIQVADAARVAIPDRVDELVTGYATYVNPFLNPSDIVNLPTGEDTFLQGLNTAYNTAYDNYGEAVATEAEASTAKVAADLALTDAQTILQKTETIYDSASARRDEMVAAETAMNVYKAATKDTIAAIDLFKQQYDIAYPDGDPAIDDDVEDLMDARGQFNEDRNSFVVAIGAAASGVAQHIGLVAAINSDLLKPAQSVTTTAEGDVRTTTQALAEAEAATAAAYTALEAAYNAAKSACSTWTPDAGKSFPPIS